MAEKSLTCDVLFAIITKHEKLADVAELADAPDLGSGGQPPCRFKSCYPH